MLIVARALQGAAGAILSPSVFSITLVTFAEGAERNKALGILGAIAGSGAAIGVLLGGVLTEYVGWEWIFFVNVPIGIARALARVPLREREPPRGRRAALRRGWRDLGHREPDAPRLRPDTGAEQGLGVRADDRRPHRFRAR